MTNLTPLSRRILDSRIPSNEQESFLSLTGSDLPHHNWLKGFKNKVLSWINKIDVNEPILIFGDYDVDGLLSSSLARILLEELGYKTNIFIPCRIKDGYGFSLQTLFSNNLQAYKNILVLDSGTNETKKAELYPSNILIIDHHTPSEKFESNILINPHFDCDKSVDFCTGSLLLMFNQILSEEYPQMNKHIPLCLTFSCVTTVADQCILVKHNRALISIGLKVAKSSPNLGFKVLIESLCNDNDISEIDLGWKICPTINAAGRLGKPSLVLDLLYTNNISHAYTHTQELIDLNTQRKEITNKSVLEAMSIADKLKDCNVLCVYNEKWHPGIVGIIAGNIAEKYSKPCFAFTKGESGKWEGSGRSSSNISILDTINLISDYVISYGGHAQAMGIKVENVNDLQQKLNTIKILPTIEVNKSSQIYDIKCSDATPQNIIGIDILRPFGNGNEEPIFSITGKIIKLSPAKSGMFGSIQDNSGTLRFYCPESLSQDLRELAESEVYIQGTLDYTPPYQPSIFIRKIYNTK